MRALPRGPVNGLFMPYLARSVIRLQPGIGTFYEKGCVRVHQVPAGKEIDRSGGVGDEGDVDKIKLTTPYFFFTS